MLEIRLAQTLLVEARMYILWLGAEEDAEEALVRLMRITRGLVDWRSVDPEYDAVLASRCR